MIPSGDGVGMHIERASVNYLAEAKIEKMRDNKPEQEGWRGRGLIHYLDGCGQREQAMHAIDEGQPEDVGCNSL